MIKKAMKDIYHILGTENFDSLDKIPGEFNKADLTEPGSTDE